MNRFLVWWALCAPALWAGAQGGPSNHAYPIHFDQQHYHAARQNWSATDDGNGMVYIANNSGILSFDGVRWRSLPGWQQQVVRCVHWASDKRLFVGAHEEFGYLLDPQSEQPRYISLSDSLPADLLHNMEFWRIYEHAGLVFFQSFGAVFTFDGQRVRQVPLPGPPVLLMQANGQLFVHIIGLGLHQWTPQGWHLLEPSRSLAHDEVKAITALGPDSLLIGAARSGLFLLHNNRLQPWFAHKTAAVARAGINAALTLGEQVVVGTIVGGIFVFDRQGELVQHLHTDNALHNNTVIGLHADRYHNLWAVLDDGVAYIRTNDPLDFYLSSNTTRRAVYDALLHQGTLWVGTNQGLFAYEQMPGSGFGQPTLVPNTQGQVWDVHLAGNQVLCGHNNGTYLVDAQGAKPISNYSGGFCLHPVQWNGQQRLLQGTYTQLLVYATEPRLRLQYAIAGFSEPVPSLAVDHAGRIWAAHLHRGVYELKLNARFDSVVHQRLIDRRSGLLHDSRVSVSVVDGRVVFATGRQLYTYDDLQDTVVAYKWLNHTLGEFAQAERIVPADAGRYWAFAQNTVLLFELRHNQFKALFRYDLARQGAYNTTLFPNAATLADGQYLLGLDNGFAIYRHHTQHQERPMGVLLRSVETREVGGPRQSLPPDVPEASLRYRYNTVVFRFSPSELLVAPQFRYRLVGFDSTWSPWHEQSEVLFERLPPGPYRFEVQLRNIRGDHSPTTTYTLRILPPWYRSPWAWVLYALALVALVLWIHRWMRRRIHLHAHALHQKQIEENNRKQLLEEQMRIRQNNQLLQDEVNHQNAELANYSLVLSQLNSHIGQLKDELNSQRKQLGNRLPKSYWQRLLSIVEAMENRPEAWDAFELHFDRVNDQYVQRLKAQFPELTASDLRLCVLLKLNLTTKEIAPLLNISVRGVEVRRYRLRKRLNLKSEDNLLEFLLAF